VIVGNISFLDLKPPGGPFASAIDFGLMDYHRAHHCAPSRA